ncbi:MAG: J domain-containing protein, partial [Hymenobacteraceae bacterium]|nr:J domain-containing protein [Hymenobacteraceae bacterium]
SDEDIKRTYRRLAQRFHPDSNPNNPGAVLQFQDINTAYNLLSGCILTVVPRPACHPTLPFSTKSAF